MLRIGIMGGTFDPVHYGHLVAAEQAWYRFGLDKVVFVPTGRPPHKPESQVSDAHHRLRMTVLATQSNEHFEVSSVEVDRPGPTYAIDTVRQFRDAYPPGTALLHNWRRRHPDHDGMEGFRHFGATVRVRGGDPPRLPAGR